MPRRRTFWCGSRYRVKIRRAIVDPVGQAPEMSSQLPEFPFQILGVVVSQLQNRPDSQLAETEISLGPHSPEPRNGQRIQKALQVSRDDQDEPIWFLDVGSDFGHHTPACSALGVGTHNYGFAGVVGRVALLDGGVKRVHVDVNNDPIHHFVPVRPGAAAVV